MCWAKGLKDEREGCDVRLGAELGSERKVKLCADQMDGCVRKGGCNYRLWKKEVGGARKAAVNGSLVRSNASKAKVLVIPVTPPCRYPGFELFLLAGRSCALGT